jgi:hypothetical protein
LTRVLVAIAEIESPVRVVMSLAHSTMMMASRIPDSPTTWPKRRNMITPRIVSVLGVKTPPKVPNFSAAGSLRGTVGGAVDMDAKARAGASAEGGQFSRMPPPAGGGRVG